MINLINRIFKEAGFEEIENVNEDYKIYTLKEHQNYWVIVQRDDITKVLSEQINIFVNAKQNIVDSIFDKNANLLVINRVDKISDIKLESQLQIEENPYHFKKSVLYYTDNEFRNLSDQIGEAPVLSTIEKLILTNKIFETHKTNYDANAFESFIYRIAIKLPFIKIKIQQTNNLRSLEEMNKSKIKNKQVNDLLEHFFLLGDENFNTLTADEIIEKLKTKSTNEN